MSVVGPGPHPVCEICLTRGPIAAVDLRPPGDAVAAVLLVPGYTGSKEDFWPIADAVVGSGRRYVAVDQRGQHDSPGPDDPAAYTVDALAAELVELRERLDDGAVHLVGHSFGGLVARAAVLLRPSAFASLTLLGSGPAAVDGATAERVAVLRGLIGTLSLDEIADLTAQDAVNLARSAEVRDFLRARFVGTAAASYDGMGQAIVAEPDRVDALRRCGVPLLVAHGEGDDVWLPATQRTMAERLGAEYAVIGEAMHSPAVENPEGTALALTSFWTSVEDPSRR